MYERFFKRVFDIVLALITLALALPFMALITVIVRVTMGKPVIFAQDRPGKDGKLFKLYKFRTMTNKKDEYGRLLPDEERLTKTGAFLRKTSLDELPELINILIGDMSFVGPRPQLIKDMVFFTPEIMRRQRVTPGLTGLAQIKGRNDISWERKFELDMEYISEITFLRDLKILFLTFAAVFSARGVSTQGMATAEDYGDYLLRTGKISEEEYEEKMSKLK
jgi:undecaprenyl phosphate N,N'-diacetylbacillosamine 1-phosphate transferase